MDDHSNININAKHDSYWNDSYQPIYFNTAKKNQKADVVIIGGGIAGISIAYNVLKAGLSAIVVEDGSIGSGETGHTTAHLTNALDDRYYELERLFGKEGASLIADSHSRAIDFIEDTTKN